MDADGRRRACLPLDRQRGSGGVVSEANDSHRAPGARDESRQPGRKIVTRTKGRTNGPITQFVSPSDLGQSIKPFVMLARYSVPEAATFQYPMHPHSGVASLAMIVEGKR